jgi:hypothetical protein
VRQYLVLVFQFHPEHGIRQGFNNRCHYFNRVFFAQSVPYEYPVPGTQKIQNQLKTLGR